MSDLSWLNPTPHAIAVYASQPLSPVATQHSLPSGRYSLLGPVFHRLDRTRPSSCWATAGRKRSRARHRQHTDKLDGTKLPKIRMHLSLLPSRAAARSRPDAVPAAQSGLVAGVEVSGEAVSSMPSSRRIRRKSCRVFSTDRQSLGVPGTANTRRSPRGVAQRSCTCFPPWAISGWWMPASPVL